MPLPEDVGRWVSQHFSETKRESAVALLLAAEDHNRQPASPRLLRCLAFASRGNLTLLERLVKLLAIDFRDVIVAGEYESRDGKLVLVRDFNQPMC